ncbi:hypothetical protein G9A89_008257 [Geosiphon pyriformis]|nr:hypothetical protein G9A89_008257 [Geosiphon pyriformis]
MFGSDELNYYEWIPWEGLSNIKEIAKGGFGIIYKATLIDGLIDLESIKHHGSMEYKRWGKREVAIKIIKTNSSEVFKEEQYLSYISPILGVTQNTETLEYGIVMEFAKHGDIVACCIAFGLSKIHSSGMSILETSDYVNHEATTTAEKKKIYGVIPYIPPEVLRGEKFTIAGDIYNFAPCYYGN